MRRVAVLVVPLLLWGCAGGDAPTAGGAPTTAPPATSGTPSGDAPTVGGAPTTAPPATAGTPSGDAPTAGEAPASAQTAAGTPFDAGAEAPATTAATAVAPAAAAEPPPTAPTVPAATTESQPAATTVPVPVPTTDPTTTTAPLVTGAAAAFSPDHLMVGPGSFFESADDPRLVAAPEATWLEPDDVVLGVLQGGEAVAFPVDQMAYHHIANTSVAGEPWLVTY